MLADRDRDCFLFVGGPQTAPIYRRPDSIVTKYTNSLVLKMMKRKIDAKWGRGGCEHIEGQRRTHLKKSTSAWIGISSGGRWSKIDDRRIGTALHFVCAVHCRENHCFAVQIGASSALCTIATTTTCQDYVYHRFFLPSDVYNNGPLPFLLFLATSPVPSIMPPAISFACTLFLRLLCLSWVLARHLARGSPSSDISRCVPCHTTVAYFCA
jgi:hypothetical protein